jgi:bifunctional DNase/RNase
VENMQEMELIGVRVEMPTNAPMVLLRERGGEGRTVPIYIGAPEATAIALALDGVDTPRPMTHDLLRDLLDELAVDVERIVVSDLHDKTFFAEIHLLRDGEAHVVSSRPSDAIALAARTGTPIFAAENVIDDVGYSEVSEEGEEGEQSEEVVEEFKEFLSNISPEDFED